VILAKTPDKAMRLTTNPVLVLVLFVGILGLFGGCSQEKSQDERQPASLLTESQRDSVLAASKIPGAKAVGRALAISDSAKARAKRLDDSQP
jgi:hypothetical protein